MPTPDDDGWKAAAVAALGAEGSRSEHAEFAQRGGVGLSGGAQRGRARDAKMAAAIIVAPTTWMRTKKRKTRRR